MTNHWNIHNTAQCTTKCCEKRLKCELKCGLVQQKLQKKDTPPDAAESWFLWYISLALQKTKPSWSSFLSFLTFVSPSELSNAYFLVCIIWREDTCRKYLPAHWQKTVLVCIWTISRLVPISINFSFSQVYIIIITWPYLSD